MVKAAAGDNSDRCAGSRAPAAIGRLEAVPDHQGRPQRGRPCCAAAVCRPPAGTMQPCLWGLRGPAALKHTTVCQGCSAVSLSVGIIDSMTLTLLCSDCAAPTGRRCSDGKVAPGAHRGSHVDWRAAVQGASALPNWRHNSDVIRIVRWPTQIQPLPSIVVERVHVHSRRA